MTKQKGKLFNSRMVATLLVPILTVWPSCAQVPFSTWALYNSTYTVVYDSHTNLPRSAKWVLRPADFAVKRPRAAKYFRQDKRLPKPRVKDIDYRNSGYMRGHLCPAGDRTMTVAMMKETFLMSNIAPMTAALNCGRWADVESECRRLAALYDSVRIEVATLILGADTIWIGGHKIAVPTAFIKECRRASNDSLLGVWFFNQ